MTESQPPLAVKNPNEEPPFISSHLLWLEQTKGRLAPPIITAEIDHVLTQMNALDSARKKRWLVMLSAAAISIPLIGIVFNKPIKKYLGW